MNQSPYFFSDRRAHLAALFAVIVTAAAMRLWLLAGYAGLDDGEYARIAYQIANGTFSLKDYNGPAVFPLRVGLVLPTSLAFRMYGLSELSMVLYPLVLSVLAIPLIYVCTAHFFNPRAGLIAAALLGVMPLEVGGATKLLPDMPGAFYAALGVTVVCIASRMSAERNAAAYFLGGVLAGIAFGLSWLCKEAISFLAPFCLAFMAITIKQRGRIALTLWLGVAVGSLGILLCEMVVYQRLTGDLLFRFHEIERNYREIQNGFFKEGSDFGWQEGESYVRAVVKRLLISGPALLLLDFDFLFLPLIGVIAACHGWYSRDKSFLVPTLWLATLLVMFNFSSTSISAYMPMPLFHRYFWQIIFPSVVLASGLIGKLVFDGMGAPQNEAVRERRFWGLLMAVALLLVGTYYVQGALRSSPSAWAAEVRGLGSIVTPSRPLYTDTLSIRGFQFFSGYPNKTMWTDFADIVSPSEIPSGSLVLVNKAYINWLNKNGGMWLSPRSGYAKHEFYENPPPSWTKIWHSGNAKLYRVD